MFEKEGPIETRLKEDYERREHNRVKDSDTTIHRDNDPNSNNNKNNKK